MLRPSDPRAAILAGGLATRMHGRNKALIEVDGRAILDRQLDALGARFAPGAVVAVVAAGAGDDAAAPFAARGLAVVRDREGGQGPLAGLAAALAWADGALLFALACDMPSVDPRVIALILDRACAAHADLALPVADGRAQPLCACYSARCAPLIERQLAAGQRRASALPDAARAAGLIVEVIEAEELRTVDPDLRSFVNVNSPSDAT
ncbi:MAG TPA: molybdenum cofactor guanylyltransferase [Kofleriaceae bacterium]|nr:molybdenum cofactor guanylyltransferase [Kofleriaceae bacterium]